MTLSRTVSFALAGAAIGPPRPPIPYPTVVPGTFERPRDHPCPVRVFVPPSVYATAVGLSVASGRLGSILGPLIGGYLISARLGWNRLFVLAALPIIAAAVTMTALAITGRRGREEAQP